MEPTRRKMIQLSSAGLSTGLLSTATAAKTEPTVQSKSEGEPPKFGETRWQYGRNKRNQSNLPRKNIRSNLDEKWSTSPATPNACRTQWISSVSSTILAGIETFGGDIGGILAISKESGEKLWEQLTKKSATAPAIGENSAIVSAGNLYRIDIDSGEEVWNLQFPTETVSPVTVGELAYVNTEQQLYAADPKTGEVRWSTKRGKGPAPAPAEIDDTVIVAGISTTDGNRSGSVRAVDTSGNLIWDYELKSPVSSKIAARNGNIYFTTSIGEVVSLSIANGKKNWINKMSSGRTQGISITNSRLYTCDHNGIVYAFSHQGDLEWKYRTKSGTVPEIVPFQEKIYVPLQSDSPILLSPGGNKIGSFSPDHSASFTSITGDRQGYYAGVTNSTDKLKISKFE